jgi:hypothetical protein
MFKLLNKLFGSRRPALRAAPVPAPAARAAATAGAATPAPAPAPEKAVEAAVRQATTRPRLDAATPPEQLCGLTPEMTKEQIRDHLAMLYQRHNRAASSLEADLREEAELMLDAVVRCRETFLGTPGGSSSKTPAKSPGA